jgi:hypothetical protein
VHGPGGDQPDSSGLERRLEDTAVRVWVAHQAGLTPPKCAVQWAGCSRDECIGSFISGASHIHAESIEYYDALSGTPVGDERRGT